MKSLGTKVRMALRSIGVTETIRLDHPEYEVETEVGMLRVAPGNGKITCQFSEPDVARQKVLCNPHTGRWNHFQLQGESTEEFVEQFKLSLMSIKDTQ